MGGGLWGARALCAIATTLLCMLASAGSAQAQLPPERAGVVANTTAPKLTKVDDGGWTTKVALTNLTREPLELSAQPLDLGDTGCTPSVPKDLPPDVTTPVKVEIDAICKFDGKKFKFEIDAERAGTGDTVASILFTAGPKPKKKAEKTTDWDALQAFIWWPLAAAVFVAILYWRWRIAGFVGPAPAAAADDAETSHDTAPGDDLTPEEAAAGRRFLTPLSSLEKSWSLKESWVSNITLGTALLTGVFGSTEVVTALLGKDAKSALATVIVGSALAAALVAVGPLILAATQTVKEKFTVGGLMMATAVTLGGALAELWVVADSAARLPTLDGISWLPWVVMAAIVLLLLFYTYRNADVTVRAGTAPASNEPSEALVAAGLIFNAIRGGLPDRDITNEDLARVNRALSGGDVEAPLTEEAIAATISRLYGHPGTLAYPTGKVSSGAAMI